MACPSDEIIKRIGVAIGRGGPKAAREISEEAYKHIYKGNGCETCKNKCNPWIGTRNENLGGTPPNTY